MESRSQCVGATIRKLHWNELRGLYADSVIDGKQSETVTELSNSFTLLFNCDSGAKTQNTTPLENPPGDLHLATPLYYHYVSEALVKAGSVGLALISMKSRYALMLEASDVPMIWEFWSPYVRPFSCREIYDPSGGYTGQPASPVHAGGVGPAWTLSKHVLGVYPVGAGFKRCRIQPKTADLSFVSGIFPSVRGDIAVN